MRFLLIFAFLTMFFVPLPSLAQEAEVNYRTTGLPIPRFVSLRSDKVFVRTGPALRYPIKWIFHKDGLPVEVVQEFDTWRKVRDIEGDEGWIHQSLLSSRRAVLISSKEMVGLQKTPETGARLMAMLEPNVVAELHTCEGEWCDVSAGGYRGWAQRKFLWGIYDREDVR